jgi:hypothetical protein
MTTRQTYSVTYYAGPYSGTRVVVASDSEEAIALVRSWVRRQMSLSMYADGYKAVSL